MRSVGLSVHLGQPVGNQTWQKASVLPLGFIDKAIGSQCRYLCVERQNWSNHRYHFTTGTHWLANRDPHAWKGRSCRNVAVAMVAWESMDECDQRNGFFVDTRSSNRYRMVSTAPRACEMDRPCSRNTTQDSRQRTRRGNPTASAPPTSLYKYSSITRINRSLQVYSVRKHNDMNASLTGTL